LLFAIAFLLRTLKNLEVFGLKSLGLQYVLFMFAVKVQRKNVSPCVIKLLVSYLPRESKNYHKGDIPLKNLGSAVS